MLVNTAKNVKNNRPKDTGITSQKKLDDVRKVYVGASHEPDGEMIQEMPSELEGGMQKARDIAKRNIIRKKWMKM